MKHAIIPGACATSLRRAGATVTSLIVASFGGGCAVALPYTDLEMEVCDNTRDDDGDGLLDCADPDCDGTCAETGALCSDERDNDRDGDVDWRDPQCWSEVARTEIDTCTSIQGGEWSFPPELGRAWVLDAGDVRVDTLTDGRAVLVGPSDGVGAISTRATTTGAYRAAEIDLELAYWPSGGSIRLDLPDPRATAGDLSEAEYAARVVAEGRWEVSATLNPDLPLGTTLIEVLAPTDSPLLLTVRARPAEAWELLGPEGEPLWGYTVTSSQRDEPFALGLVLRREAGLVDARVARPNWNPCGDGVDRPQLDLVTSDFEGTHVAAAAEPDGSVCMLIYGSGPLHWRRQRRGATSSEMLGVAEESGASDVRWMYIDDAGAVHAVAEVDGTLVRMDAGACGATLVRDPAPITVTSPPGTQLTPVAFAGGVLGEAILFETRSGGASELATAVPVEGSRHTFALGEGSAQTHFNGTPSRVGHHWVVPRQDVNDSITMRTIGDEEPFASAAASRVPGTWENSFPGTIVWLPGDATDEIEGLWIRSVRVPDPARLTYSLAWGLMMTRITVRPPE